MNRLALRIAFSGHKSITTALLIALIGIFTACGGGGSDSSAAASAPAAPATPELTSISVGPPDSTVAAGQSKQFTATGLYSDGSKQDVSSSVTWSSSTPVVSSINSQGLAIGVSPGSTTISIGVNGALTLVNTVSTGNNPSFITIDPSGQYVYVTNKSDNTTSEYAIGAGGVLTSIGTIATGNSPTAITTSY
jgi:hypothetical protein